ncbi:MAG: response regulator [Deltaproteobacteria bacterium]|nr:response regulator [Deltaproteobacteria bacterium]
MPRILLVDDDDESREALSMLLRLRGFEVVEARDGQSGLDALEDEAPHLVLMDMNMPDIDGWEATRRLKALPGGAAVPVVGLSAHALARDRDRAVAAGCVAFHTKPVEIEELVETIEAQLGGS